VRAAVFHEPHRVEVAGWVCIAGLPVAIGMALHAPRAAPEGRDERAPRSLGQTAVRKAATSAAVAGGSGGAP
jgi:hypothetical protein